ncbi:uncharacterized protein LOC108739724 isoform X2 [Agrilus planipennis]|uniref:Uncharacterized protein LOC108739724 isoform X2 n=1 Tax=Agrilus planipennis TaxID=224129 RepID=A0A1W4WZE3_AGRPL|nr:uncharacterized protein LOC108739724 isoform X2 [Agrilus planipennis]
MSSQPMTVQAVYSFKGKNNDELCFKKGDKIVITQKEEGGWWEGTLGDKTGWFPSNYVVECKDVHTNLAMVNQQKQYRSVVLKDLIDSEKAHVTEQQGLVSNFLQPLEKSSILSVDEYRQLTGNLLEVLDTHQQLLHLLEEEESKTSEEQRVGRLFLTWAPKMKSVHQGYCSLHPKAAFILDKYKDELTTYMESCGATTPGVLVLTVGLSKPFRRLEKYSGMLQELERHLEESHPDRGDTQRSVSVYKEIATSCAAIRRQKELELQVLTGPVRGWEGQSLSTLGEIIYMGSVAVGPQHHDRYLVLFPSTLLILSVSPRLSAFIYEGKLPLTGINVIRLEDSDQYKNAFEINGHLIEKRTAVCQSKEEADRWVEILRKHMPHRSNVNSFNQKALPSQAEVVPQPPPHQLDHRGYSISPSVLTYFFDPPLPYQPSFPTQNYPPTAPYINLTRHYRRLIKENLINLRLLMKLWYSEYLNKKDLSCVKRRKHKTEIVIVTNNSHQRYSIVECDSDSDSESSSNNNYPNRLNRQNALNGKSDSDNTSSGSSSSSSSNPFGYIRYYNPQTGEEQEIEKYESFIDYGEINSGAKIIENPNVENNGNHLRPKLTHQFSENSNASSNIEVKPLGACENLLSLDCNLKINTTIPMVSSPLERQTLPPKFVGNRFCQSSLTTVEVPHWQSNSDDNLAYRSEVASRTRNKNFEGPSTHSSTLELAINPLPVELPDKLVAEILYNQDEGALSSSRDYFKSESLDSDLTEHSSNTVKHRKQLTKKSTESSTSLRSNNSKDFSEKEADFQANFLHIPRNRSGTGLSSIDVSTMKPRRRSSTHIKSEELGKLNNNLNSLRRCMSYQIVQVSDDPLPSDKSKRCDCCALACNGSSRSSDSGMAGSCTLNSPDLLPNDPAQDRISSNSSNLSNFLNNCDLNMLTFSEIEARKFERQCQCTSPFGSTPRTSCQTSTSENVGTDAVASTSTNSVDLSCLSIPHPSVSENLIHSKLSQIRQASSKNADEQNTKVDNDLVKENAFEPGIYRSGLYAHWWLKAKIPAEVIAGIHDATKTGKDVTSDNRNRNIKLDQSSRKRNKP